MSLKLKEVEKVEGSDKLLACLDAGDGEDRQILSGIAKFSSKRTRVGRQETKVVANLKPRKMMKKYTLRYDSFPQNMMENSLS